MGGQPLLKEVTKLAHKHPEGQRVIAQGVSSTEGGFDFEAPAIEKKETEQTAAQVQYQTFAAGGSIVVVVAVALGAWALTLRISKLSRKFLSNKASTDSATVTLNPSWHLLSLLTHLFLAGNVFFGALSAFLLTGNEAEAVQDYFLEMSPFKVAKLSHQHFFGYGILFGVVTAAAFIFVGRDKRRVLFPAVLGFAFTGLDISAWWLSRFVNVGFHNLSVVGGAMFSLAFLCLFFQTVSKNVTTLFAKQ